MWQFVLSLFAGLILPLAFAPFGLWPLCYISIIIFLATLIHAKNKSSFKLGFLYGIGSLGFGVSWIFNSIYEFSGIALPVAILCTTLFILFFSILPGLWSYSFTKFFKPNTLNILLAFPALGVFSEWCRSNIFSGFPWLLYGYSQTDSLIGSLAKIIGVYGVSFTTLILSAAFYLYFKKVRLVNTLSIMLIISLAIISHKLNFVEPSTTKHKVAILQSNLNPQQQATTYGNINDTWHLYSQQISKNLDQDLIIWPESSIPVPLPYATGFIKYLQQFSTQHKLSMILGILEQDPHNHRNFFNSLLVVGLGTGQYYKHHLVPFGEYIPYKKFLIPILNAIGAPVSSIVPSTSKQLVEIPGLKIVPAICYEITFTDFIRQAIHQFDAHLIVNISEDGWFGDSLGPHQHLQIARMRAIENGVYVIRSTPTGISAIIDYNGKILNQAPQFKETFINGEIYELHGHTPWSKIGQWPVLLIILITLVFLMVINRKKII